MEVSPLADGTNGLTPEYQSVAEQVEEGDGVVMTEAALERGKPIISVDEVEDETYDREWRGRTRMVIDRDMPKAEELVDGMFVFLWV